MSLDQLKVDSAVLGIWSNNGLGLVEKNACDKLAHLCINVSKVAEGGFSATFNSLDASADPYLLM